MFNFKIKIPLIILYLKQAFFDRELLILRYHVLFSVTGMEFDIFIFIADQRQYYSCSVTCNGHWQGPLQWHGHGAIWRDKYLPLFWRIQKVWSIWGKMGLIFPQIPLHLFLDDQNIPPQTHTSLFDQNNPHFVFPGHVAGQKPLNWLFDPFEAI